MKHSSLLALAAPVILSLTLVEPAGAGRVHPDVELELTQGRPGELHRVIVELVPQVDPQAAAAAAPQQTRHARGAAVVATLQSLAAQTQSGVLALLASQQAAGQVGRYRALWILNALVVRGATEPAIRALAAHPDVWEVRFDRPIPPPAPVPATDNASATANEWNIDKILAPVVWNLGHTGVGAVIGSFDTGVNVAHPDLASRYRGNHAISWFDPYDENATPFDANGHGTHTTGTAVGGSASGTSIGVAPGAQWIAAKAWNNAGAGSTSSFHEIFQWFLAPGGNPANAPDVVNNSWAFLDAGCFGEFRADVQAWRAAGIFPAFAAGNYGPGVGSARTPGADGDSFGVGATTSTDAIASFSGRGPSVCDGLIKPDISAPGYAVRSAYFGGYQSLSGTSMATPHVTGAVAVLRGIDQTLTVGELETLLTQTALDLGTAGPDNTFGAGRLDLLAAVQALTGESLALPDLKVSSLTNPPASVSAAATFSVTDVTRNDGTPAPASTTAYYLSLTPTKDASAVRFSATRAVVALVTGGTSSGTLTLTVPAATPAGSYYLIGCADDASGVVESDEANNCRTSTTRVQIAAPDLTVTAVSNPPATVFRGGTFQVTDTTTNLMTASAAASTVRYYLSLDAVKGTGDWLLTGSRAITGVAGLGSSTGTVTVTVPMTVPLSTYVLLACADDLGQVVEGVETNNCRASATTVQITGADLTVTAVSDPPMSIHRGGSFTVTDTVVNLAPAAATGSSVRYYLSLDAVKGTGDWLLTGSRVINGVAGLGSSTGTAAVTVPMTVPLNTYVLIACADDMSQVAENVETNNCRASATTVQVTGADLTVTALSDPPVSIHRGGSFTVTDTVANLAPAAATASSVRYYLSLDAVKGTGDWLLTGSRVITGVAGFGSSTGTATVTVTTSVSLNTYFLIACADDMGQVAENVETNNCRTSTTTIQITGPDLIVTAVSAPPASIARGGSFSVTDTVTNQALAAATTSSVRYYLSVDGIKGGDTLLTGSRSAGALGGQGTSTGTATVTVPTSTPLGSYFVLACADDLLQVVETVEANNCLPSASAVSVTP